MTYVSHTRDTAFCVGALPVAVATHQQLPAEIMRCRLSEQFLLTM